MRSHQFVRCPGQQIPHCDAAGICVPLVTILCTMTPRITILLKHLFLFCRAHRCYTGQISYLDPGFSHILIRSVTSAMSADTLKNAQLQEHMFVQDGSRYVLDTDILEIVRSLDEMSI